MAQLTDDCFAFSGPLMPVDEVERLVTARVVPVNETEVVDLANACGRVVASDVVAAVDLPPFDNAAVDGFAVHHADLTPSAETRLAIVDRVMAGQSAARALSPGEAIRIFTGAPMPHGADTVFMQEDCRVEGEAVVVPSGLKAGANRRLAGEDIRSGSVALPAGRRLAPQHLALAAAIGVTEIAVRRRVRVALFSTGEADHVRSAVEKVGRLVFWRVAIKPGRPVAMGVIPGSSPGAGAAFVGLPGNPVAVFVTFARVVRPLLLRLAGAVPEPLIALPVRAAFAYRKKKGRREYVRVALTRLADGGIEASKYPREGAGVISSLTETDGLAELTEDMTVIEPGATIGFLPYAVLT